MIPSLPGFGFSGKPSESGWDVSRIARAWAALMHRLSYDRWFAQGGDWGASVTMDIARQAPAGCAGIHLNFVPYQPTPEEMNNATPEEQAMLADARRYQQQLSAYAQVMGTRPQTIGYALADSPVALVAWIYTLFQDVSGGDEDPEHLFGMDAMLDDIMLYWLPNTGASSARLYWEGRAAMAPGQTPPAPVEMPTAISIFPDEQLRLSRRWAERRFANLVHFAEREQGGHFAALEQPAAFVEELRAGFRSLRN